MDQVKEIQGGKIIPLRRRIHETAIVHPKAELGPDVEVGPYAVIGEDVVVGDGTRIGPHVVIEGPTVLGRGNRIHAGAVLGNEPQDLKYGNERTLLIVGDNNIIREHVTIARGTVTGRGETRIGSDNFIMSAAHVAHDCLLGNRVIMTHGAALAGCVTVEDQAVIGGMAGVHQFVKVGRMAMVGAHSMVNKDVPPFLIVHGNPARVYGLNFVGLRRNGVPAEVRAEIKSAFRILYRSRLNVSQAIDRMEQELAGCEEIDHFLRFLRAATRGICAGTQGGITPA